MGTTRRVFAVGLGAAALVALDEMHAAANEKKGGYCAYCTGHGQCHSHFCNRHHRCYPKGVNPCSGYERHTSFQCRHGRKRCCIPRTNECRSVPA